MKDAERIAASFNKIAEGLKELGFGIVGLDDGLGTLGFRVVIGNDEKLLRFRSWYDHELGALVGIDFRSPIWTELTCRYPKPESTKPQRRRGRGRKT